MECRHVNERLPWYLNDSLEAPERQQVEAHLESCDGCRRELQETVVAAKIYAAHPSIEALMDLADERLMTSDRRQLLERHVDGCAACREQFELVRESRSSMVEEAGDVVSIDRQSSTPAGWRWGALAASFLAVVAISGWWSSSQEARQLRSGLTSQQQQGQGQGQGQARFEARERELVERLEEIETEADRLRLQQTQLAEELAERSREGDRLLELVDDLQAPRLNVWVDDVYDTQTVLRSDGEDVNELRLPPGAEQIVLILNTDHERTYSEYEVELHEGSNMRWRRSGLDRQPQGDFTLALRVADLPSSAFTLEVYGRDGSGREAVARFPIVILRP